MIKKIPFINLKMLLKKFKLFKYKISLTKNLKKKQIREICKIKNKHWKFSMKSQIEWFKKNSFPNDIHYQIYQKNMLIGYLHLGTRSLENFKRNNNKYILFRNLIVDKNFRSRGISKKIMNFANKYISSRKKIGFLICKKKLIYFYKKHKWKFYPKKNFILNDHSHQKMSFMFYNLKFIKKFKLSYKI